MTPSAPVDMVTAAGAFDQKIYTYVPRTIRSIGTNFTSENDVGMKVTNHFAECGSSLREQVKVYWIGGRESWWSS
eukprot:COSAG02_NODE_4629_length_5148_cov_4.810061_4_plen_75_part_00